MAVTNAIVKTFTDTILQRIGVVDARVALSHQQNAELIDVLRQLVEAFMKFNEALAQIQAAIEAEDSDARTRVQSLTDQLNRLLAGKDELTPEQEQKVLVMVRNIRALNPSDPTTRPSPGAEPTPPPVIPTPTPTGTPAPPVANPDDPITASPTPTPTPTSDDPAASPIKPSPNPDDPV